MSSDRWFHRNGRGARIVGDGPKYRVMFDDQSIRADYETEDFDAAIADVRDYVGFPCCKGVEVLRLFADRADD